MIKLSQERNVIGAWHKQKNAAENPGNAVGALNALEQEIRFRRGESFDVAITLASQRDKSRVRFTVRLGEGATTSGDESEDYLIRKFSYEGAMDSRRGVITVHLGRADTMAHPYGPGYRWRADVTSAVQEVGRHRARRIEGSNILFGASLAAAAQAGDVVGFGEQRGVITAIGADYVVTDRADWGKGSAEASVWRGETTVIAAGPWKCLP